jgi:hypothetical protein
MKLKNRIAPSLHENIFKIKYIAFQKINPNQIFYYLFISIQQI